MQALLKEPYLWVVVAVALVVVVLLAIRFKRGLKVSLGKDGVQVDVQENRDHTEEIDVGSGIRIKDGEAGNIIGERTEASKDGGAAPSSKKVKVAAGAVIDRSKVGDIIGSEKVDRKE